MENASYFTVEIVFLFRDRDRAITVFSNVVPISSPLCPQAFINSPTSLSVLKRRTNITLKDVERFRTPGDGVRTAKEWGRDGKVAVKFLQIKHVIPLYG